MFAPLFTEESLQHPSPATVPPVRWIPTLLQIISQDHLQVPTALKTPKVYFHPENGHTRYHGHQILPTSTTSIRFSKTFQSAVCNQWPPGS